MDEACEALGSNRPTSGSFLSEMARWLSDRQGQVDEHFGRTGSARPEEFEHGLMELGVPCPPFQLHSLIQLLKNTDNTISYRHLSRRLQSLSQREQSDSTDTSSGGVSCFHQLGPLTPGKRFIRLSVRLIPFDSPAPHPMNFEAVLPSSVKVSRVIGMIRERLGIHTGGMELFRSRAPTEEARLAARASLEECGFGGGPEESPPEAAVFYDYQLPSTDCPILNCDHYFRAKPGAAATATATTAHRR